jgi:hypothetical protein
VVDLASGLADGFVAVICACILKPKLFIGKIYRNLGKKSKFYKGEILVSRYVFGG